MLTFPDIYQPRSHETEKFGGIFPGGTRMIYELAVVVHPESGEAGVESAKKLVQESLGQFNGEVVLDDDWGVRSFGQPKNDGLTKGHYLYFMYKSDIGVNKELERRFKISESIINTLVVKLGEDNNRVKKP